MSLIISSKTDVDDTKIFRIYGPPGTGKTTALLNKVDDALNDGVHPNKIGYFAFTRQAANEVVDRAVKRLNWCRTNCLGSGPCTVLLCVVRHTPRTDHAAGAL